MTRLRWLAVALVLAFGVIRQPVERTIAASLERNQFREANLLPDGPMREKLGQMGAAAALGGFRSFLATLSELRAITAYSDVDYEAVESHYHMATQLQPWEPGYWNTAGWMLDTNARRFYLSFDRAHSPSERQTLAGLSVQRGKKFLDDGLLYNPSDYVLNRALGNHYAHRREDYCAAAAAFGDAAALLEGSSAAARQHAIYLALCPGREEEAYAKLRAIGERIVAGESPIPSDRMPGSLVLHMRYLERVLGIPSRDAFQTPFDLGRLYQRLRSRLPANMTSSDWARIPRIHRIRLRRLEAILEIPRMQRIPFQEALRPGGGDGN